ncbi:mfsd7-A [Symbiodinium sp. CCMP2456]|nr:mfsd7-A [Symbiodinium sp. CCMP2456]
MFLLATASDLPEAEHSQARALLRAAHLQGAHVNFLFPRKADQVLQRAYTHLCQELAAHCRESDAFRPSLLFCSSDCSHWSISKFRVSCLITTRPTVPRWAMTTSPCIAFSSFCPAPSTRYACLPGDGAGLFSSADHAANNISTKAQPLAKLAQDRHEQAKEGAPLSDYRGTVLAELSSWLPRHAQLLEVGSLKIGSKQDVPRVPPSHKHQWVRLADPTRQEIHLRTESKFVLQWLSLCFAHEQPRSLRAAPRMHCLSAADAFADKDRMGIGGWLSTAQHFIWYSEIFTADQVRAEWPQLTGSLQPYIGCFETLTQLALAQCSWQLLRARHVRFVLPSASDNTSAEAGLNKLFSTAEPLGTFLRLAATWAHLHRVQFDVEHLAGEKNTWADALSRGRIAFMTLCGTAVPSARVSR